MNYRWSLVVIAGCLIAGCSSQSDALKGEGQEPGGSVVSKTPTAAGMTGTDADLVGAWKGDLQMPPETKAAKDNPMAGFAEGMAKMLTGNLKLEFKPGNEFALKMVVPIEGKYTRNGNKLTLTPEKVMGMTPEEAAKMSGKSAMPMDGNKPLEAVLSADGRRSPSPGTRAAATWCSIAT